MKCPLCGRMITHWEQRPGARQAGYCSCHSAGPVLTVPAGLLPDLLLTIPGITVEMAAALHARGLDNGPAIGAVSDAALRAIPGLGPARVRHIREFFEEEINDHCK